MSKNSRRNRRDQLQKQELEQVRSEVQQNPRVNPVRIGPQKGKSAPKVRQQPPELTSVMSKPVEGNRTCERAETGVPEWLEGYLKYQSEFAMQLGNQIVEDHQVLTDHKWRLHHLEEHVGLDPLPSKSVKTEPEVKEPESEVKNPAESEILPPDKECLIPIVKPEDVKSEPEPQPKSQPQPEPQPVSESEPWVRPSMLDEVIPREMYEAKSWEGGKWRLRGPYKRINQAEQVAQGDLSKVKIVQVWYDPQNELVLGYLSAEEMERYL